MFEMLGNWSFGEYSKEKAIDLAWEFLVVKCKLDKERIYVTFFEGDQKENSENSSTNPEKETALSKYWVNLNEKSKNNDKDGDRIICCYYFRYQ